MDAMAAHQEAAYELLYRWIQRKLFGFIISLFKNNEVKIVSGECRLFNVDMSEVNQLVCKAFQSLENRPVLFK